MWDELRSASVGAGKPFHLVLSQEMRRIPKVNKVQCILAPGLSNFHHSLPQYPSHLIDMQPHAKFHLSAPHTIPKSFPPHLTLSLAASSQTLGIGIMGWAWALACVFQVFRRGLLLAWQDYICSLIVTLRRLPEHTGRCYRGIPASWAEQVEMYPKGIFHTTCFFIITHVVSSSQVSMNWVSTCMLDCRSRF